MDAGESPPEVPQLFTMKVVNSQGTSTFEDIKPESAMTATEHSTGEVYVALDWHPAASKKFVDDDISQVSRTLYSLGSGGRFTVRLFLVY